MNSTEAEEARQRFLAAQESGRPTVLDVGASPLHPQYGRRLSGRVLVAYVHPGTQIEHSFMSSLNAVAWWDVTHKQRIAEQRLAMKCGTGGLVEARNGIFKHWLDQTDVEWLWMVDTDMGFSADVIDRLIEAADAVERPVVGALTFGLKHTAADGYGGYVTRPFPVMYGWGEGPEGHDGFRAVEAYPDNTVVQIAGTGAACLLVHRSVAEKLRAEHGDAWFEPVRYPDGRVLSEDLSFCYRLLRNKVPLFVHTGVKTTHAKQIWLCEADYLAFQTIAEAVAAAGPPVPEGVSVVGPVVAGTSTGGPSTPQPFPNPGRSVPQVVGVDG